MKLAKEQNALTDATTETKVEPPLTMAKRSDIRLRIRAGDLTIVDTTNVLSLAGAGMEGVYFVPIQRVRNAILHRQRPEFSHADLGGVRLFSIGIGDEVIRDAGWFLSNPTWQLWSLRKHVAFLPEAFDHYYVEYLKSNQIEGGSAVLGHRDLKELLAG